MNIEKSSFAELEKAPEFFDLLEEYALESAIYKLPHPKAKCEQYRIIDKSGIFHVFSASHKGSLIGFITVLLPILNHYSETVAVSESYFVSKAYRNTGAGTELRKAAEQFSKDKDRKSVV